MGISIMCELDAQPIPPYEGDMVKIRPWVNSGHWIRKHVNVLGTCGELDAFVSIPDEGDMTFLHKKGKSGAAVGKLVLLHVFVQWVEVLDNFLEFLVVSIFSLALVSTLL
ncbi:hypothetical protein Tco_1481620, partial [Tanacetum coccineum]